MYKNLIFDFDGTIADSKECSIVATQKSFKERGLEEPTVNLIEYYMGIPIEKSFSLMSSVDLDDHQLEALIKTFRQNYKEVESSYLKLYKHMTEQLQSLSKDKQLFVVSSKKTDVLIRNLEILDIDHLFTEVIGSDKVNHYKPSPDGINYILNKYQLENEETIYIGDAIFDMQMANSAKVASCAVTWGTHSIEELKSENPTYIIHEVTELNF
ncbi:MULTISPECIES: HAD family hydrolase [Staphylococcus]|jgi:HAD hydrolase, family IA, variant 1|uniref:HAD family hydrolase n=3 Tax=Staphylococcus TaxID=1279 RepID=A0A4U9TL33_STACP|nr:MULTISPECIES: HAD family hydrolase [Staphylococcus]EEE49361.1 HAD hydrolase, family IA, variant 1 [Staphylococcus capitis SK14]EGS40066.1 HAD hydrolase, family IA, variant 1 [Staphylococcus capitis VCU116]MBC3049675.1 HAD family hydrolase [Staphylococcus capitis]MBC3069751.1 HAD family hydrolase [Staphylococcus capitis]MBC3071837.1 HAD family hydrolase [Staphylococcus capitis]